MLLILNDSLYIRGLDIVCVDVLSLVHYHFDGVLCFTLQHKVYLQFHTARQVVSLLSLVFLQPLFNFPKLITKGSLVALVNDDAVLDDV